MYYCNHEEYFFREDTPYHIADEAMTDAMNSIYVGELAPEFFDESLNGMHGLRICYVEQEFKENGDIDEIEQAGIIKEIREYMEQYFDGWTATVRAVS